MTYINVSSNSVDIAATDIADGVKGDPEVLLQIFAEIAGDYDEKQVARFALKFAENTGGSIAEELAVHLLRACADALEAANAA